MSEALQAITLMTDNRPALEILVSAVCAIVANFYYYAYWTEVLLVNNVPGEN